MNPFSSTANETKATATVSTTNTNPITSRFSSGAEQDRYAGHFGIGAEGLDRLKHAAMAKGTGAEQDRYQAHFGLDEDRVKAAAQSLVNAKGTGAEQDRHAAHFGLGADGWERAKELARTQGVGAEQVRLLSAY
jgi:hypothetical protein